jgi:hypothetical protein
MATTNVAAEPIKLKPMEPEERVRLLQLTSALSEAHFTLIYVKMALKGMDAYGDGPPFPYEEYDDKWKQAQQDGFIAAVAMTARLGAAAIDEVERIIEDMNDTILPTYEARREALDTAAQG